MALYLRQGKQDSAQMGDVTVGIFSELGGRNPLAETAFELKAVSWFLKQSRDVRLQGRAGRAHSAQEVTYRCS